jgi:hypothetical protein
MEALKYYVHRPVVQTFNGLIDIFKGAYLVSTDVWCASCAFYILSIHSNPTAPVFLTRYPFHLPSSLVCSLCNPPRLTLISLTFEQSERP